MLVYLKNDMGYSSIDGHRVYGKKYAYGSMGPTDINYRIYLKNKNILQEAYYTPEWLKDKFKKDFPQLSFKLSKLANMPIDTLIEIAKGTGIDYIKRKNISLIEKRALIKIIRRNIS